MRRPGGPVSSLPGGPLDSLTFWTAAEAAALLRVSKMTIHRLAHSDELDAIRFGRSFRIPDVGLAQCIKDAGTGASLNGRPPP